MELNKEKRTDLLRVDPRSLIAEEGFNTRQDYGDIEGLVNSIKTFGVKQPLSGHRDPNNKGHFILTDGHRRLTALKVVIQEAMDNGEELPESIQHVPLMLEPKTYTNGERIADIIIKNQQKNLTPMEEVEVIARLEELDPEMGVEELGKAIGKTAAHVSNMRVLNSMPESVKALIHQGKISYGEVLKIYRAVGMENVEQEVNAALDRAKADGKEKATAKHVDESDAVKDKKEKTAAKKGGEKKVSKWQMFGQAVGELDEENCETSQFELANQIFWAIEEGKTVEELKAILLGKVPATATE